MRIPQSLEGLIKQGVIEEVVRPLMSGKEAHVYLVQVQGRGAVAKIYKDAHNRTFRNRAAYTEGRRVRNSRDTRAMQKRTPYGRGKDEEAWRNTEVDFIYRLRDAGVRVPEPMHFIDGVLIMELVTDANGTPAPRLADTLLSPEQARDVFQRLLAEVVRMLCAGIVHCDLSEFNVLMAADGPVIIDFPQSINAASNRNAKRLLVRDVDNLTLFVRRFAPGTRRLPYGEEIWAAFEERSLHPDTQLTGTFVPPPKTLDGAALLEEIAAAEAEESRRRVARGLPPIQPVAMAAVTPEEIAEFNRTSGARRRQRKRSADNERGTAQARTGLSGNAQARPTGERNPDRRRQDSKGPATTRRRGTGDNAQAPRDNRTGAQRGKSPSQHRNTKRAPGRLDAPRDTVHTPQGSKAPTLDARPGGVRPPPSQPSTRGAPAQAGAKESTEGAVTPRKRRRSRRRRGGAPPRGV